MSQWFPQIFVWENEINKHFTLPSASAGHLLVQPATDGAMLLCLRFGLNWHLPLRRDVTGKYWGWTHPDAEKLVVNRKLWDDCWDNYNMIIGIPIGIAKKIPHTNWGLNGTMFELNGGFCSKPCLMNYQRVLLLYPIFLSCLKFKRHNFTHMVSKVMQTIVYCNYVHACLTWYCNVCFGFATSQSSCDWWTTQSSSSKSLKRSEASFSAQICANGCLKMGYIPLNGHLYNDDFYDQPILIKGFTVNPNGHGLKIREVSHHLPRSRHIGIAMMEQRRPGFLQLLNLII